MFLQYLYLYLSIWYIHWFSVNINLLSNIKYQQVIIRQDTHFISIYFLNPPNLQLYSCYTFYSLHIKYPLNISFPWLLLSSSLTLTGTLTKIHIFEHLEKSYTVEREQVAFVFLCLCYFNQKEYFQIHSFISNFVMGEKYVEEWNYILNTTSYPPPTHKHENPETYNNKKPTPVGLRTPL